MIVIENGKNIPPGNNSFSYKYNIEPSEASELFFFNRYLISGMKECQWETWRVKGFSGKVKNG